jgi:pantoate--beta-alanine ligase
MGALHEGHRSCVDVAKRLGDLVVVSIFVNPAQFGPKEDFSRYPRPVESDLALCEEWGVDVAFVPDTHEMYPVEQEVWVDVGRFSEPLCGRLRSEHFRGVATVVLKLFHIVQPDSAVFGQKDAQQAVVIHEMVKQLDLPVRVALSPTARESDGLARSSRNSYLSAEDRRRGPWIYRSLLSGKEIVLRGERDPVRVTGEVRRQMEANGIGDIEYVELVDARDLSVPPRVEGRVLLAVAARVGATRLIDNLVLDVGRDGGVEETMLF